MKTLVGYDGGNGGRAEPPRPGQAVQIVSGPFADFYGIVETVDEERGKVRVRVSMAGRETPVELDFPQIRPYN